MVLHLQSDQQRADNPGHPDPPSRSWPPDVPDLSQRLTTSLTSLMSLMSQTSLPSPMSPMSLMHPHLAVIAAIGREGAREGESDRETERERDVFAHLEN